METQTLETTTEAAVIAQTDTPQTEQAEGEQMDFSDVIGTVQEFLPEELVRIPELNVRLFSTNSSKEQKSIAALGETILEEGQLQDAGAYPYFNQETGEVEYRLFMGNRRHAAIEHINANMHPAFPVKLRTRIFSPEEAAGLMRKAMIENLHRENFSPMALAAAIQRIRQENGWDKPEVKNWSALVADYLKVSRATVTQHVRLIDELKPEYQRKIHQEGWSAQAAFDLLDTDEAKRPQVIAQAEEIAKTEKEKAKAKGKAEAKAKPVTEKAGSSKAQAQAETKAESKGEGKGKTEDGGEKGEKGEKGAVQSKHVRKAARELDAQTKPKSLAKSEIVAVFQEVADSPAYGHANSPVRAFASYFVDKFCAGTGREKTLLEKFDAMVMSEDGVLYAGEGTPSKAEQEALAEEEARANEKAQAKGRGPAKDSGKAKAKGKSGKSAA